MRPYRRAVLGRRLRAADRADDAALQLPDANAQPQVRRLHAAPAQPTQMHARNTGNEGSDGCWHHNSIDVAHAGLLLTNKSACFPTSLPQAWVTLQALKALLPGLTEQHMSRWPPKLLRKLCADPARAAMQLVSSGMHSF